MARYLLDTDTCIYWLKGDTEIERRILAAGLEHVSISVITECELFHGAHKSARVSKNLALLEELRRKVRTVHTWPDVAPTFGKLKADLERAGSPLADADLLIGSIALASGSILATNNVRHFARIPRLMVENWRGGREAG